SGYDYRPGKRHACAIAEGGIFRYRIIVLFSRRRFSRQHGFLDPEGANAHEAHVGGYPVARLKKHYVAWHQLRYRYRLALSVAHDCRLGCNHAANGPQGVVRLAFLHETDNSVDDHHCDNHSSVDKVPKYQSDNCC